MSLGQLLRHLAKWHFRSGEIGGIELLTGGTFTRRAYERLFALFGGTNPRDISDIGPLVDKDSLGHLAQLRADVAAKFHGLH